MPVGMTYSSLVRDIQTYCERNDEPFLSMIPTFIMLAENRIASENKPLGFLRAVKGRFEGPILEKPVRWRKTRSFSLLVNGKVEYLYERGYDYCRTYAPDPNQVAIPKIYSDYDYEHWFIAPAPISGIEFEIQYYERPEPLSEKQQTSWTTQYAPQCLLYASLMEAMPFLKTSERIPEFQGLYDRAMGAIVKEDQERLQDAANTRT
jgi:hypothetical protein